MDNKKLTIIITHYIILNKYNNVSTLKLKVQTYDFARSVVERGGYISLPFHLAKKLDRQRR